ncbi:hypothetical protein GTP38_15305 [Duganella sp. FT94W]|uniref:Uncharacterized protein n=1 Tax=Duganella lactea TaxID=2692173 RepID=A0ABW9VA76_9BURK|nr:hypothetical protein [Duganella lactea]MYM35700.1 hypothetical protein [Duganella lactea]
MAKTTLREEDADDPLTLANARFEHFLKTQQSIPWALVSTYLDQRAAGKSPQRPQPQTFFGDHGSHRIDA